MNCAAVLCLYAGLGAEAVQEVLITYMAGVYCLQTAGCLSQTNSRHIGTSHSMYMLPPGH
jgi:hypothetical protein